MITLSQHAKEQILLRFSISEYQILYNALQDKSKYQLLKNTKRANMPDKKLYKISLIDVDVLFSVSDDGTILSIWRSGADGTGNH